MLFIATKIPIMIRNGIKNAEIMFAHTQEYLSMRNGYENKMKAIKTNHGGGFENKDEKIKPDCELIGQDGNVFNLMGIASQTLKHCGLKSEASEMCNRIMSSGSYDEALCIIGEYVNITGPADEFENEYDDEDEGMEMSL